MSDLSAIIHTIDPALAELCVLEQQRGMMSEAEATTTYHAIVGAAETGARCITCGASAYTGQTCAMHADPATAINAARAARPIVDLSRCSTPQLLITAVMAALKSTGREKPAGRFAERAENVLKDGRSMNALCMIARGYVKLENGLAVRDEHA